MKRKPKLTPSAILPSAMSDPEKGAGELAVEQGLTVWNCLVAKRLRRRHARCEAVAREGCRLPAIAVRETGDPRGRGVFALRDFGKGECVEVCPVVPVATDHDRLPVELRRRVFDWFALAGGPEPCAIALGYGSLYNHANPVHSAIWPTGPAASLFVAARQISTDEELTINYNRTMGGRGRCGTNGSRPTVSSRCEGIVSPKTKRTKRRAA